MNLIRRKSSWYFAATIGGKRYCETLGTCDRREAARRARAKRALIERGDWDGLQASRRRQRSVCTVHDLLAVIRRHAVVAAYPSEATLTETLRAVGRVMRALDLDAATASAAVLDGPAVARYQSAMLAPLRAANGELPDAPFVDRRRRTVASELCKVRALLSPRWVQLYVEAGLQVPEAAWARFRARDIGAVPPSQWTRPAPDVLARLAAGAAELFARDDPPDAGTRELQLCWIMARCLGMRARDMAAARWGWFEPLVSAPGAFAAEVGLIARADERYRPKAAQAWIPVAPDVFARLGRLGGALSAGGEYLLSGATPDARYRQVTALFAAWLRAVGWPADRDHCAHDLRALSADEIARDEAWGPLVSDLWLRHARAGGAPVGARHYRDAVLRMPRSFPGVGLFGWRVMPAPSMAQVGAAGGIATEGAPPPLYCI